MKQNCKQRVHCQDGSSEQKESCRKWLVCMSTQKSCIAWTEQMSEQHEAGYIIPNQVLEECVQQCSYNKITEVKGVMDCTVKCSGLPNPGYENNSKNINFSLLHLLLLAILVTIIYM